MSWFSKTPQEKADSFDAQHAHSKVQADKKQANGEYPYDQDKRIKDAGKLVEPERRTTNRKGRHAK